MAVYIKGMSNISPQRTWEQGFLADSGERHRGEKLNCIEPDYSKYIDARAIRRMSRVIRMGVASATVAMRQAGVAMPEGIITATGYGCLEDTGIFLTKMVENREMALNPTPFIQSTHNTIGSQIALLLSCQAYNQTYTQGAFSFENALLDALLQLSEAPDRSLLVGGVDEITAASHAIQRRFGIFRKNNQDSLTLFDMRERGTLNGEGSAFFVLSGNAGGDYIATVEGVSTVYKPDERSLKAELARFLDAQSLTPDSVDLVLSGGSGDLVNDGLLDQILQETFPSTAVGTFKNLCGEYPVASAFACWLAAGILKEKKVPEPVLRPGSGKPGAFKNVLIMNQYFGTHYSLILLRAC